MSYRQRARDVLLERLPVSRARKVFCLSLPKSGTSSFKDYAVAGGLTIAGSGAVHEFLQEPEETQFDRFIEVVTDRLGDRDAFRDQPWGFFADVWREKFPDARHVILRRPFESWFKSLRYHILGKPETTIFLREFLGVPRDDAEEDVFRAAYAAHYAFCAEATAGSAALTIELEEEDDASICGKLNDFLGLSVAEFPHTFKHQNALLYQVRSALKEGRDARAIREKYLAIHGEDDASTRAAELIRKAQV